MKEKFGILPTGEEAGLYTITSGALTAEITDLGASLVKLWVPDREGIPADVVLGYDDCLGYLRGRGFLGAVVSRNAGRIHNARFRLNGETVFLTPNEGGNNLHSGPDYSHTRLWQVEEHSSHTITLRQDSPHGDQGFPGNAVIRVSYTLEGTALRIVFHGISDRDTVFNPTSHSYFNLAGHQRPELAMDQTLRIPARRFLALDTENIPTGRLESVAGTPMDFRTAKPLGQDLLRQYGPLILQGGYDHNYEVCGELSAVLADPASGRVMEVFSDRPGLQVYTANFLEETGKGGTRYGNRSGVALETQFWPDSVNRPEWEQPFLRAGVPGCSETVLRFSVSYR